MATAARNSGGQLGPRTPMPVGDIPGWRQVFAEDFDVDMPLGAFTPQTSGSGQGGAGYLVSGAAAAYYGDKLTVYPSGFNASTYGKSRPEQVLSVSESHLIYNFNVNTAGEAAAATVRYLIGNAVRAGSGNGYWIDPAVGGRFEWSFKLDGAEGLTGWGAVAQLIANNADWVAGHGEMDVLEGSLYGATPGHGMETNWHPFRPTNDGVEQWNNQDWGSGVQHKLVVEWLPVGNPTEPTGRETVILDGRKLGETRTQVAQNYRGLFVFQTGVNTVPPAAGTAKPGGGVYPANGQTRGRLMVDYVVAYVPTTNSGTAAQMSGGRLTAAIPAPAARMAGGSLSASATPAVRMAGGTLSVPTGPTPGRYRYDGDTQTWRPVVRYRYDLPSATWVPRPYGTL